MAAVQLRRRGGLLASAPILDATELARTATSLRVYQRPLPLGIRGLLACADGSRPALVVNARLPGVDRNVSAAHELGHWVLHEAERQTTPGAVSASVVNGKRIGSRWNCCCRERLSCGCWPSVGAHWETRQRGSECVEPTYPVGFANCD